MPRAHLGPANAQHLMAAGLAYLAFCALFFWCELPSRWNMFWALTMTYASIVLVPQTPNLKKRAVIIFAFFLIFGAFSPLFYTGWEYFTWDDAMFSAVVAALNPFSLLFVAVYLIVILVTRTLLGART